MNKTILLAGCFLLAFLALAGCTAAVALAPTSTPPTPATSPAQYPSPVPDAVVDRGIWYGFADVEMELPDTMRPNEPITITWTVKPHWSCWEGLPVTTTVMTTWIEIPQIWAVVNIPPGMTWQPLENIPWDCQGCSGALQAQEVLQLGESRQYDVPIWPIPQDGGSIAFKMVVVTVSFFIPGRGVAGDDVTTFDAPLTFDPDFFNVPADWPPERETCAYAAPSPSMPNDVWLVTPLPVITPSPADDWPPPPPVITPDMRNVEIP
jgi:hypothetical protein